jgi:predicted amino acid racemase
VTAPRLEVHLDRVEANARSLVDRLAAKGIRVTGVTKAALGAPEVGAAMARGGVTGLADSRVANLDRLRGAELGLPLTLVRSPMLTQVAAVVAAADISLNTELTVLAALSAAAVHHGRRHGVVLMVELGDLREGLAAVDLVDVARVVQQQPGLELAGVGTNLACQSGVVPDQSKMDQLSELVAQVEARCGRPLSTVSGGNSANLGWALATDDVGRIDELRLGEAILLGTDPLDRSTVAGLQTDACTLVAEVIEAKVKPSQPWGELAQGAFGVPSPRPGTGAIHQVLLALGRQDVDPDDLVGPVGMTILGASSDHLVLDAADHDLAVGDEVTFQLGYSALVRAMTSPFVTTTFRQTGTNVDA